MRADSFHVVNGRIVLDRRTGTTIERTTYDQAGAQVLLDQLAAAVCQGKKPA